MTVREDLERELGAVPGLVRRRSRFGDSASYFVADREIAHFHGDTRMDVRLTKERIKELRAAGALDPRIRTRGSYAEWAEVRIASARDIPFAVGLVEEALRANS